MMTKAYVALETFLECWYTLEHGANLPFAYQVMCHCDCQLVLLHVRKPWSLESSSCLYFASATDMHSDQIPDLVARRMRSMSAPSSFDVV